MLIVKTEAKKNSALRTTELIKYVNLCLYFSYKVFQAVKLMHLHKWTKPRAIYVPGKDWPTNTVTHKLEQKAKAHLMFHVLKVTPVLSYSLKNADREQEHHRHSQAVQVGFILFSLLIHSNFSASKAAQLWKMYKSLAQV